MSDRRGTRAWQVHGPRGAAALKANNPDSGGTRERAAEIRQEDDHLVRLTTAGALPPDYRIDAGGWRGGRWLAVRWVDGTPLWPAFAGARGADGDSPLVRPWLLAALRTWAAQLAPLHAAGWAHADVQPTNTLVTEHGHVAVIDYASACGPGTHRRLPYRGALTHTTAPEIAAAILDTSADTHIQAQPSADIWSLGASLFWCWTGHRPVAYDDVTERLEKLRAISRGTTSPLSDLRPWSFPAFEEAITACLAPVPADRPTAGELADSW